MSASSRYNYDDTFELDATEKGQVAVAGEGWANNSFDGDNSADEFDYDDLTTTESSVSSRIQSVRQNKSGSKTVQTKKKTTNKHDANENATEKETPEEKDMNVMNESEGNIISETGDNITSRDEDNLIGRDEDNLISMDEDDVISTNVGYLSDQSLSRYQEQLKITKPRNVMVSDKLCVDQCHLAGKRVLIRVDYDVPVKDGVVTNNQKIKASLSTIKYVRKKGAMCVVLMSHLGTPDGRVVPELSLKPVAVELQKLIKKPVTFLKDCVGPDVESACREPRQGSIILLENLRFHIEEEGLRVGESVNMIQATPFDVDKFRNSLCQLGDIYVNDAFSSAHQSHCSIVGCTLHQRALGFLMKQEMQNFSQIIRNPKRPLLAIFGGAKVSEKIPMIETLLDFVNEIIITGGVAFTFLKILQEMPIGNSVYDEQGAEIVPRLMEKAQTNNVAVHLPVDFKVSDHLSEESNVVSCTIDDGVPVDMMGLDVGDKSNDIFTKVILRAKTVVWYGPPGVYEMDKFAEGTRCMMNAVVQATKKGAVTVLGGGDTVTCAQKFQTEQLVTHISTAGLKLLGGQVLPGIDFLSNAPRKRDVDKLKLNQCSLSGKRVMIRTDLDVQVGQNGLIGSGKLSVTLPTIQFVLHQNPRYVLLLGQLGHPRGRPHHVYSLRPMVKELETLLDRDVVFLPDCVGPQVEDELAATSPGAVVLLENVGFHPEEEGIERKDGQWMKCTTEDIKDFRQSLSRLCDVYINDDFGSSHLPLSSVVGVNVTEKAVSMSCHNDLKLLEDFNQADKTPYLAIIGGVETAEKLFVMNDLLNEVDEMMIVGGMANYFLKVSKGLNIQSHLYDKFGAEPCVQIQEFAAKNGIVIHWPIDFIVGDGQSSEAKVEMMDILETIPDGWMILDVGEQTYSRFKGIITKSKKIVWYGSPGVCEMEIFSTGTKTLVNSLGQAIKSGTSVMVLGESTVDVWNQWKEQSVECHVNKKGKACLAFLAGTDLPGVATLNQNPDHKKIKRKKRKRKKQKKMPTEEIVEEETETEIEIEDVPEPPSSPPPPNYPPPQPTVTKRYVSPYNRQLPPLQTYQKPRPRIKYTGAPPPGQNKPYTSPLFKFKPWAQPQPVFSPPRKPPVPRLSGQPESRPAVIQQRQPNLPLSQKYKVGEAGKPGPEFILNPIKPLPPISGTQIGSPRYQRVPVQLPTVAKIDSSGNLTINIEGDSRNIPPGATIQVTLVSGYAPMADTTKSLLSPTKKMGFRFVPKLMPLPPEYTTELDANLLDDVPQRGRLPKLNTTITFENHVRYRRIFPSSGGECRPHSSDCC